MSWAALIPVAIGAVQQLTKGGQQQPQSAPAPNAQPTAPLAAAAPFQPSWGTPGMQGAALAGRGPLGPPPAGGASQASGVGAAPSAAMQQLAQWLMLQQLLSQQAGAFNPLTGRFGALQGQPTTGAGEGVQPSGYTDASAWGRTT